MSESLENVIIQVFMQGGTNLMFEHENLFWPPKNMRSDPVPGFVWPKGGFNRTVTHWKYKPLTGSAYGTELMDSIKYKFQKNENAFCQWFSLIFFFADHGDYNAKRVLSEFREDYNIQNAKLVVKWVFESDITIVDAMCRDLAYLPNMVSFWNEGKSAAHRLSASQIKQLFRGHGAFLSPSTPSSPGLKSPGPFKKNGVMDKKLFYKILLEAVNDLGE